MIKKIMSYVCEHHSGYHCEMISEILCFLLCTSRHSLQI